MRRARSLSLAGLALLMGTWGAAGADEAADALIRKAQQRATRARTLLADMTYSRPERGGQQVTVYASLRLMKPNAGRVEYRNVPGGDVSFISLSDGKSSFLILPEVAQYRKLPAAPKGVRGLIGPPEVNVPITAFFDPTVIPSGTACHATGVRQYDGREFQVVEFPPKSAAGTVRYLFGRDGLLEGVEVESTDPERAGTASLWLKKIRLNASMRAAEFAYDPPAGFKLASDARDTLLAVGTKAPEFRLPVPGGGKLSLAAAREGKKAVLINFWFYGCGPCREEFPHLQRIYDKLKEKGLELVAVNAFDDEEIIRRFVGENRLGFKVVMSGPGEKSRLGKAYGVQAYPTNYLIDGNGVVVWRSVGFDEEALREALAKLGLK